MTIRLRALFLSAHLPLLVMGCGDVAIFEKVNTDPHPPAIANLQYAPETVLPQDTIRGTFTYIDPGGDIEIVTMRDLNGTGSLSPTPPPVVIGADPETGEPIEEIPTIFFFPGTAGTTEWQLLFETNQGGTHTIKVWLEDSEGSRSEPVFFNVTVNPPPP